MIDKILRHIKLSNISWKKINSIMKTISQFYKTKSTKKKESQGI